MCSTVFRCEPRGGAPGERAQSLQESSSGDSGLLKVKEDDRSAHGHTELDSRLWSSTVQIVISCLCCHYVPE